MNDWDAVSSDTPPHSVTDAWDKVSTPQPVTPPIKETSFEAEILPEHQQEERQIDATSAEAHAAIPGLSADLAAAIARKKRRQQGQPIGEEEPQVIASVTAGSDILETGELSEQPAPVLDTAVPERVFETRKLPDAEIPAIFSYEEPPEDEVIEASCRSAQRREARIPVKRRGLTGASIASIVLCIAVIGLSAFSALEIFHVVNFNRGSLSVSAMSPTAPQTEGLTSGQVQATNIVINANASATSLTSLEQAPPVADPIYNQLTSATPSVNDPLSDDTNNWGVFTTNWGGKCAFSGGSYHLSLAQPNYVLFCNCAAIALFNNFALQIDMNIVQGSEGGVVFGQTNGTNFSIIIGSDGSYTLNGPTTLLGSVGTIEQSSSPAIKRGLNQINRIIVIVKDNNFYFYANNQFVTQEQLDAYIAGGADLAAVSLAQPTDVEFNNLKIWTL